MAGKSRTGPYSNRTLKIFPGSLEERSIHRLRDGASEKALRYDMNRSGPLVEEFVDDGFEIDDFTRVNGRDIYYLLRGAMVSQGRIGDPIPNKELEAIAISEGYKRLTARISIRDAWKMGASRRFIRGMWEWSFNGNSTGGKRYGVHYILGKTTADR